MNFLKCCQISIDPKEVGTEVSQAQETKPKWLEHIPFPMMGVENVWNGWLRLHFQSDELEDVRHDLKQLNLTN